MLRGKPLSAEIFVNNRGKHAVQEYFTRRRDPRRHFGGRFHLFGCAAGYEEHAWNEDGQHQLPKEEDDSKKEPTSKETQHGEHARNEHAWCEDVQNASHETSAQAITCAFDDETANAEHAGNDHARNEDAGNQAVTDAHSFTPTDEYARHADANSLAKSAGLAATADADEHAGNANAAGFAIARRSTDRIPTDEYADAWSESLRQSDGPNARHEHGGNEYEPGAIDGDDR